MNRYERYVAIGDSTTEGLEDPDGQGGYRGWANRFAEHMASAFGGIDYANLAVRGRTAELILKEQLAPALALKPDVATVVAGVNDLLRPSFDADATANQVATMVGALREHGATVLTFTMPDLSRVMPMARLLRGRLDALNERLRATTNRSGALLLDLALHPLAADPRLWHGDRLHANALGHERIGQGLAHTLGLPGFERWSAPLPEVPAPRRRDLVRAELQWARAYLVPWVSRHARGESSGDDRVAKRPALLRVLP